MSFKENLKAELTYTGMHVKELAELSGIKKQTIDSYLRENHYIPSVESAVKIAKVLGVSVEYLVTGKEAKNRETLSSLNYETRLLIKSLEQLDVENRKIAIDNTLNLIKALQHRHSP